MLRYLLTRLGLLIPTFVGMTLVAFFLIRLVPGDPIEALAGERGISEERHTIEDVLEPYLIQQGYIMRTPRGRVVTRHAYLHFGLNIPSRMGDMPVVDEFLDAVDD